MHFFLMTDTPCRYIHCYHGQCVISGSSWYCSCYPGYYGTHCECKYSEQIYHVWEGYLRKIPVERRKISRADIIYLFNYTEYLLEHWLNKYYNIFCLSFSGIFCFYWAFLRNILTCYKPFEEFLFLLFLYLHKAMPPTISHNLRLT